MQKRMNHPRRIYVRRQIALIAALVVAIAITMIAPQPEDFRGSLPDLQGEEYFEARLYGLSEEGAELYARQNALNVVQFTHQYPQFHVDNRWWANYREPARSHYEGCFQSFVPEWAKQEALLR